MNAKESQREAKNGGKFSRLHRGFNLNSMLRYLQLCSWDHKKTTGPSVWLPHLAFAIHHEKQCFIAVIFYYLKRIVTWHIISIILCRLSHWKREQKIWNTLCECFNILSKKAGFVWVNLNCSTSYSTGKIYTSSSNKLCEIICIESGESH